MISSGFRGGRTGCGPPVGDGPTPSLPLSGKFLDPPLDLGFVCSYNDNISIPFMNVRKLG